MPNSLSGGWCKAHLPLPRLLKIWVSNFSSLPICSQTRKTSRFSKNHFTSNNLLTLMGTNRDCHQMAWVNSLIRIFTLKTSNSKLLTTKIKVTSNRKAISNRMVRMTTSNTLVGLTFRLTTTRSFRWLADWLEQRAATWSASLRSAARGLLSSNFRKLWSLDWEAKAQASRKDQGRKRAMNLCISALAQGTLTSTRSHVTTCRS